MNIAIDRPHQTKISVSTNVKWIGQQLLLRYGDYAEEKKAHNGFYMEIKSNGDGFSIKTQDGICTTMYPIWCVEDIINRATVFDDSVTVFHGSAIKINDHVILLMAPTKTGKTTLVTYLVEHGCKYLADDCVLIKNQTMTIVPFTMPLKIRDGGLNVLYKSHCIPKYILPSSDGQDNRFIYNPETTRKELEEQRVKKILFISREENRNIIHRMSESKNIECVMNSTKISYDITDVDRIKVFVHLSAIGGFQLEFCDFEYVLHILDCISR